MVRLFTIAATVALLQYSVQALNIGEVDPKTIENSKDSDFFVAYYNPECKHCSEFEPKWQQLAKSYPSATFAKLNCANHLEYCKEKGIVGVPNIQSNSNGGQWKEYQGDFSLQDVNDYIKENQVKRNQQGETVGIVSSKQLKNMIQSKEPWFVKFYAPWCGHCKHLAPIWTDLAKELKDKVNVAEVNCETHKALCEEFKVSGLPTLSYFVHGALLNYHGDRKLEKLKEYALEMAGSPVHEVETDENLQEIFKQRDVNFVHVVDPSTNVDEISFLETIAPGFMETLPFYTTKDKKTALRFNLNPSDLPASVIVKDGTFHLFKSDIKDLASWLINESQPLVTRVVPNNSRNILKGNQLVVLGITDPEDVDAEWKLREIAKIYRDEQGGKDVTFAQLDGKKWGKFITRVYGIQSNKLPALVVLDPKSELYYDHHADQKKFSFENPDEILSSIKVLDSLTGISTAPSKTLGKIERFFVFFGEHWLLVTPIIFGFFAIIFYFLTREDSKTLTREEMKEVAKKVIQENKEKKAAENKAD